MRIVHNYGLVRIVSLGDPFHNTYDIQAQIKTESGWELYHGFNSLSDDYAYTNAMEAASRAIAKVAKEKASTLFAEKVL